MKNKVTLIVFCIFGVVLCSCILSICLARAYYINSITYGEYYQRLHNDESNVVTFQCPQGYHFRLYLSGAEDIQINDFSMNVQLADNASQTVLTGKMSMAESPKRLPRNNCVMSNSVAVLMLHWNNIGRSILLDDVLLPGIVYNLNIKNFNAIKHNKISLWLGYEGEIGRKYYIPSQAQKEL